MSKKKLFLIALTLVFILIGSACGSNSTQNTAPSTTEENKAPEPQEVVLKLAHSVDDKGVFQYGAVTFANLVSEKSGGKIKVEVFPNKLLGSDREFIEGLQLGTVDMAISDAGNVTFVPELQSIALPYIFRDKAHAFAVLDGPIGQELFAKLEKSGIVGLAFLENGTRNLTNSKKPVKSVADVKGLKIRTTEVPMYVDFWKEVGVAPTPMAFGELYTALQQGTVDGQENPVALIYSSKFYEVNKYLSLTGHVYAASPLMISKKKFDALPEAYQKAIREAAEETRTKQREYCVEFQVKALEELKKSGMQIEENPDLTGFRTAAEKIQKIYGEKLGLTEIVERIVNTK